MEIGWTDVGSGEYIIVSCAHSNTSFPSLLNAASLIHVHGKEYLMQFYMIKFASGLWQFCCKSNYHMIMIMTAPAIEINSHKITISNFSNTLKFYLTSDVDTSCIFFCVNDLWKDYFLILMLDYICFSCIKLWSV
jgi:hypothetical protein